MNNNRELINPPLIAILLIKGMPTHNQYTNVDRLDYSTIFMISKSAKKIEDSLISDLIATG